MFYSPSTHSLRSLNECNARPKRTSYGNMSTWFFMDKNSMDETFENQPKNTINSNRSLTNDIKLPPLTKSNLPTARQLAESPVVRKFLMKNWSEKRSEVNSISANIDPERKGKSGSSWTNITQAYKEDGKRFLFVDGSKGSFKNQSKSSSAKKDIPVSYLGPNTKALMDKLERERLGIQTRYGVDYGNWNIVR